MRNESFLVYGATALLVVIVVVAVVFGEGESQPVNAQMRSGEVAQVQGADDLERLLNLDPIGPLGPESGDAAIVDDDATPKDGADGSEEGMEETDESPQTDPDAAIGNGGVPLTTLDGIPPDVRPSVELIGSERVDGGYRRVTVRAGDSLSQLVSRWCGSQDYLPLAEALNEDIDHQHLEPGSQILLPWVSDEIVRAAQREREVSSTRVSQAEGKHYTIRGGDSLWRIARAATGSDRQAANYVKEILDVNPGIVPEKLREGQKIVLP